MLMITLRICLKCLKEANAGECHGPCPCPHDPAGANIAVHGERWDCPLGKFPGKTKPADLGDLDVDQAAHMAKQKSCCDPP